LTALQKNATTTSFEDLLTELQRFIASEKQKAIEIQTDAIEAFCIADIELVRNVKCHNNPN